MPALLITPFQGSNKHVKLCPEGRKFFFSLTALPHGGVGGGGGKLKLFLFF